MRPTLAERLRKGLRCALRGAEGSCGRVLVSWTLAGGVAGGGMLVGMLTAAGVVSPGFQLLAAPVLFIVGAFLGLLHGFGLALAGRHAALGTGETLERLVIAALLALPGLALAWLVTAAISVTAAVVTEPRVSWVAVAGSGWLAGVALCGWAGLEGWGAVCRATTRLPWLRTTGKVTLASIPALAGLLIVLRPRILGTELHLNAVGAIVLALILAAWVVLPIASVFFRALSGVVMSHPHEQEAGF